MRLWIYARRTAKEMLRDPLNFAFGLGFPIVVLLLLTAIQRGVGDDVQLFNLEKLTPGIAVFGFSFIALFSGTLIAKDRVSSLLTRLYTTPLKPADYILGYILPLIPMALAQCLICYAVSFLLGLKITAGFVVAWLTSLPAAMIFIALGLICGSVFNDKQVGGVCGALLTNVTAWLSGTWFDLNLVGGAFKAIANALPFAHAVEVGRAALAGNYAAMFPHLWWVLGYAIVLSVLSVILFRRKMRVE